MSKPLRNRFLKSLTLKNSLCNLLAGVGLSVAALALLPSQASADVIVNTTCQLNNDDALFEGSYFDVYYFDGVAGDPITVLMSSLDFDTNVRLVDADGETIAENDDMSESDSNSRFTAEIPYDGGFAIVATSYNPSGEGGYHLIAATGGNASSAAIADEISLAVSCS